MNILFQCCKWRYFNMRLLCSEREKQSKKIYFPHFFYKPKANINFFQRKHITIIIKIIGDFVGVFPHHLHYESRKCCYKNHFFSTTKQSLQFRSAPFFLHLFFWICRIIIQESYAHNNWKSTKCARKKNRMKSTFFITI